MAAPALSLVVILLVVVVDESLSTVDVSLLELVVEVPPVSLLKGAIEAVNKFVPMTDKAAIYTEIVSIICRDNAT